jgi:hypothetical protein
VDRRAFLSGSTLAPGVLGPAAAADNGQTAGNAALPGPLKPAAWANPSSGYSPFTTPDYYVYADNLTIERPASGKPHSGKVPAAIQAHSDDIPL